MSKSNRWLLVAIFFAIAAVLPFSSRAVLAVELTGFWLTTPHPELSIRPGETDSIPLTLRNASLPPQRASLEVSGVPQDWKWSLKGGGSEISAVIVSPDSTEDVKLELTPPAGAKGERIPITVRARYGTETAELPLAISLSDAPKGGFELKSDLPALKGTARSTFSFKVTVTNKGAQENLVNLAAQVPEGFTTRFKRGYGSEEITGLPIKAGESENITLEVTPARAAAAGRYPVVMAVKAGDATAQTQLAIDIAGEPDIGLSGPQQRLSGEAVAGKEASFPFTVTNTGSAPANGLEISASAPSGWKAEVEPKTIETLPPNGTGEVAVKITPSERAIAGDYMVTVRASGGGASESAQFRVTVNTSTVWGIAGLGIIALAALILGMAVLRYGRR
ncbi:MAG: NEW3 domain-containing protein [Parvibaculaceae bacterium]